MGGCEFESLHLSTGGDFQVKFIGVHRGGILHNGTTSQHIEDTRLD